jgi:hypothetical protein
MDVTEIKIKLKYSVWDVTVTYQTRITYERNHTHADAIK